MVLRTRRVVSSSQPRDEPVEVLLVGTRDWVATVVATPGDDDVSISVVATVEEALARLREDSIAIDCVVSAYDLFDADGLQLLRELRTTHPRVPVVLYPPDGDEGVASEAIAAGVTEYVVPSETSDRELREGVERALATARTEANRIRRARQFDTSFSDSVTASWVLDLDGTVQRANDAARELCGDPSAELGGHSFWELQLWESERDADRVRTAFEDALGGSPRTVEITCDMPVASRSSISRYERFPTRAALLHRCSRRRSTSPNAPNWSAISASPNGCTEWS
jgi:PAS domain-containing protein